MCRVLLLVTAGLALALCLVACEEEGEGLTSELTPAPTPTTEQTTPTPTPMPTPIPTRLPAPKVVVVSTNAFITDSSVLIGGESRKFHIVAELRNDSPGEVEIGEASIRIYDASGELVGQRSPTPFDKILPAGGTTAVEDQVPSLTYLSDETNDFPEGWATYEVTLSPEYYEPSEPGPKPVEVAVQDVEWDTTRSGASVITGSLVNIDDEPAEWADVYAILYASDGRIVNAENHAMVLVSEPLDPGHSIPFEIMFLHDEPLNYARYVVDAYADTGWR